MQIQQCWRGHGTQPGTAFEQRFLPNFGRDFAGGPLGFSALALDFHLENGIGLFPVADSGVGQQGDEAVLKGLKSTLDLAFGSCSQVVKFHSFPCYKKMKGTSPCP